ncbi:hypothetical protein K443DRAFT_228909 [Laccaria amethystina LaAM-08-1]|uniref:Uncharacterized protein n=1 Tax=Laccaria amethystina LaAM-08-1 TaxID=1095629 RepID=A0A0C9Y9A6_9AGAR|nr:hypothetical protein K443DRAFT_228909 [Laccaria amethystina LaAM-08-1]
MTYHIYEEATLSIQTDNIKRTSILVTCPAVSQERGEYWCVGCRRTLATHVGARLVEECVKKNRGRGASGNENRWRGTSAC